MPQTYTPRQSRSVGYPSAQALSLVPLSHLRYARVFVHRHAVLVLLNALGRSHL